MSNALQVIGQSQKISACKITNRSQQVVRSRRDTVVSQSTADRIAKHGDSTSVIRQLRATALSPRVQE